MPVTPRECIDRDWTRFIGSGQIGLGLDLATTENETSNPSALCVMERSGPVFMQRLVLRFKTRREEITRALLDIVFNDLVLARHRPLRMCVDASNERFFSQSLQKQFSRFCPVQLIVANEKTEWKGEDFDYKTLLGNIYVNSFVDAAMRMPEAHWLKEDHRLVKRDKGRFIASQSPDGGHADTFDAGKLARFALEGRGRAEASGAGVGQGSLGARVPAGLKNPLLRRAVAERRGKTIC